MGVGLVKWGKPAQALSAFEQAASLDANFAKASHNVEILKAQKAKGGVVTEPKRIQELESLEQEDEEFGAMDFGVSQAPVETKEGGAAEADEIDDSYFQSLVSGS
jgi:hypothetical protein